MEKLTEDEFFGISQLKNDINMVLLNLGQITLEINILEENLSKLKEAKLNYIGTYKALEEQNKNLTDVLFAKYGQISVNLTTGEIS